MSPLHTSRPASVSGFLHGPDCWGTYRRGLDSRSFRTRSWSKKHYCCFWWLHCLTTDGYETPSELRIPRIYPNQLFEETGGKKTRRGSKSCSDSEENQTGRMTTFDSCVHWAKGKPLHSQKWSISAHLSKNPFHQDYCLAYYYKRPHLLI